MAAKNRILTQSRAQTLQPRKKDTVSRVPFVLTYHPTNALVAKVIRDNFAVLQDDPTTKNIFPEPPLISYRKDRSLRQMLVKSKLLTIPGTGSSTVPTVPPGLVPCKRPRCKTCNVVSPTAKINGPKITWEIRGSFSCTTTDCIYAIHCKLCNQLYIGETKRRLADRTTEHLRSITLNTPGLPVAQHFNQPNHSVNNFEVCIVTSGFSSDVARKEQEEKLIHRLGCLQPRGINVSFRSFPVV